MFMSIDFQKYEHYLSFCSQNNIFIIYPNYNTSNILNNLISIKYFFQQLIDTKIYLLNDFMNETSVIFPLFLKFIQVQSLDTILIHINRTHIMFSF